MATPINQFLAHWGQAFSNFSLSANEFYSLLEKTIKEHEFPEVKISKTNLKEKGMLSANREYLEVKYKNLIYLICAMQFGKDFSITSWLYEGESGVQTLFKYTKVGSYLKNKQSQKTFYQADTEAMFKNCVHNSLLEAIDNLTKSKGMRVLSDAQRIIQ